ncbi:MAG TPA: phage tail protein [Gemmatimonadales bacterium]|nr:phage tail protein [Gemmatimonadales bacterium]
MNKGLRRGNEREAASRLVGEVIAYAGSTAPSGWLLCDGSLKSRSEYAALFAVISTTYNTGSETADVFRLPNLKGKVIVGVDAAQTEFDTLGETGGSKNIVVGALPTHTHGFGHTHGMNSVNTRHAHNVYARNQDTGTVSAWHTHNYDHWHNSWVGNVKAWSGFSHQHVNAGGYASEGAEQGSSGAGNIPVNVSGTGAGGTGNPSANHTHNFNHDHPSTNYQDESPWGGGTATNHDHTTNTQSVSTTDGGTGGGSAAGNMPPYAVMNYLIKT